MTEAGRRPADAAARAAALDPARSFIVQAPAGSGKTEILIRRILALLAQAEAPEEIVALTFTRKAAGEMRARVLGALGRAAVETPPAGVHERETWELARAALARDRALGWALDAHPGRLRVMTLDGLCALLVRRMPLLSRLGGAVTPVDDPAELYRAAARATLQLLEDGEPAQRDAVAQVLLHLDNRSGAVEALLIAMLGKRDQWIRHVARGSRSQDRAELEQALAAVRAAACARARELIAPLADRLVPLAAQAAAQLDAGSGAALLACRDLAALPADADADAWRGLAELLLTNDGEWRRKVDRRQGFLPASGERDPVRKRALQQAQDAIKALLADCAAVDGLRAALAALPQLPTARYDDAQWAVLTAVLDLLQLAAAQLEVVFAGRGAVDFPALAQAALRALGTSEAPTDLLLSLDARIRHLLVDEFQDTSVTQYELLRRLTAGWSDGDGRTLFLVGDPMQSIYRFREAEVGLFLRARNAGLGGLRPAPLVLTTNFRSAQGVVDWVNRAFGQVFPPQEDVVRGAVPFAPATHWHDDGTGADAGEAVTVHAAVAADDAAEAARVAGLIAAALAADPAASVAVLVRGRSHLADIVPALRARGLPLRAVEIESLGARPVVLDLLALTRALLHPADRVAWLAVLRAPWCGLRLADLHAIAGGDDGRGLLWPRLAAPAVQAALSDDGRARSAHLIAALAPALEGVRRAPLRDVVHGAWLRLGGPACAAAPRDLDDALAFLDLLSAQARGADLADRALFEQQVAALFAAPDPLPPDAPAVEVMTIHKAKGLEFDVVIVPRLGRRPRSGEAPLLAWRELPRADGQGEALLLGAISARGADAADPVHDYVCRLERERERLEAARLLYVAATRARRRLHLLGTAAPGDGGAPKEPAADSLLACLWPVVQPQFAAAAGQAAAAVAPAPVAIDQRLRRLPPALLGAAPALPAAVEVPAILPVRRAPLPEFSWAGETVRHVGTVVHRWLQRIATDLARWDEARLRAARDAIARELAALGVPAPEQPAAAERALAALRWALRDARGRWMLGAQRDAASELRLTGIDGGELVDVAIDRSFVDADGRRWIIDYKTGGHEGGATDAFIDNEVERYRPQLERYARLLRPLGTEPIRCGLYFPLLQAWREWVPGVDSA